MTYHGGHGKSIRRDLAVFVSTAWHIPHVSHVLRGHQKYFDHTGILIHFSLIKLIRYFDCIQMHYQSGLVNTRPCKRQIKCNFYSVNVSLKHISRH